MRKPRKIHASRREFLTGLALLGASSVVQGRAGLVPAPAGQGSSDSALPADARKAARDQILSSFDQRAPQLLRPAEGILLRPSLSNQNTMTMNCKQYPGWGGRSAVLLLALAVGLALAPATAWSQNLGYYQFYNVAVGAENINSIDTRQVVAFANLQPAGAMITNLVLAGGYGTGTLTASVSYGAVQVTAGCSLNRPASGQGDIFASISSVADSSLPLVYFSDTLQITSATLLAGTPVTLRFSSVYGGAVTPAGVTVDPDGFSGGTQGSAWASLGCPTQGIITNGAVGGVSRTNVLGLTIQASVGDAVPFIAGVTIIGEVYADYLSAGMYSAFAGAVSASVANVIYVDVLTPGAGYTAASRTVYPALVAAAPTLRIQAATNGVTLLWPVGEIPFRLLQNPDLSRTNWIASTNVSWVFNGTNQVTISPVGGNRCFQLVYP